MDSAKRMPRLAGMRGNFAAAIVGIVIAVAATCLPVRSVAQNTSTEESMATTLAGKPAKKFSTAGHAKAKGIDLTIKYPADWKAAEGDRPNIVQKFVNPTSTALVMIGTRTFPGETPSKEEVAEFLADREGVAQLVSPNSKALDFKFTKLEAEPAAIIEFMDSRERAGIQVNSRVVCLVFFRGSTVVMVHGMVGGPNSDTATASKNFESYRGLFTLMFSSIVFNDKWRG
jgi:hypothetical protein